MSFDDIENQPPARNEQDYRSMSTLETIAPDMRQNETIQVNSINDEKVNQQSVITTEKQCSIISDIPFKQPPHNLEIEASVIGAILRNNQLLERTDILRSEHFYAPEHQTIFNWILQSSAAGQLATPTTLAHYADNKASIKVLGGKEYLAELASDVISVINIKEHAETLLDLFVKRRLIDVGEDLVNSAYNLEIDNTGAKQIEFAEQTLFNLAESGDSNTQIVGLGSAVGSALKNAEKAFLSDNQVVGLTTGLRDVDSKLGGLHRSDLLILAGRPAMGKTALVTNMAFSAASKYRVIQNDQGEDIKEGGIVLFFSLEMSSEQLASRILSEQAEISSDKIRRGDINVKQFERIQKAAGNLANVPLYIDDTPGISVTALRQRARRLKRRQGLDMIIVDYLQLLQGPAGKKFNNRVNEVSEITRSLKMIAKELDVPVVALSQLSRSVESREDKHPMLSDLRESGSIEQDADVVMFIYRHEYYLQGSETKRRPNEKQEHFDQREKEHTADINEARNKAELIIAKNRHGPTYKVDLFFNGEFAKFGDLDVNH